MAQNVVKIAFSKYYDFSSNGQKSSDGPARTTVGRSDAPQIKKCGTINRNQLFYKTDIKMVSKPYKTKIERR